MRPKQIRQIDRDGSTIPSGRAIVTDQSGAKWSRGALSLPIVADGRLSITSGAPVPSEGTGTNLYYTPYSGAIISLYYPDIGWQYASFNPEITFDVSSGLDADNNPIVANGTYDVFVYDGGTQLSIELVPWSNSGGSLWLDTRVVSLTKLDGVYVKSSDFSRRYVGTFTNIGGVIEFASTRKALWNLHNQVQIGSTVRTTGSATHSSTGQIINVTGAFVVGLPTKVRLEAYSGGFNSTASASGNNNNMSLGIEVDDVTSPANLVGTGRQRFTANLPSDPIDFSGIKVMAFHIDWFGAGYHKAEAITDAQIGASGINLQSVISGEPARGMTITYLG